MPTPFQQTDEEAATLDITAHDATIANVGGAGNVGNAGAKRPWSAWLFLLCYFVFMGGSVLYNGQILKFAGNGIYIALNHGIYFFGIISILLGILFGEIVASIGGFFVFAYLSALAIIGARVSPLGFSNSVILPFVTVLYAPIIAYLFRKGMFREFYIATAIICTFYCVVYDFLSLTVSAGSQFQVSGSGFIAASDDRGARIYLDAVASTMCLFLGLASIKNRTYVFSGLFMTVMATLALYLSYSRTLEAKTAFMAIVYLALGTRMFTQRIFQAVVAMATIGFIVHFLSDGNIYSLMANGDASISVRGIELENARGWINDNMLLGIGFVNPLLPGEHASYNFTRDVLWNDLGIYGVLYAAGLCGAVVYFTMNMMMISSGPALRRIAAPRTVLDAIVMVGTGVALTSVSVTTAWDTGLEIFAMVIAAVAVARTRTNSVTDEFP